MNQATLTHEDHKMGRFKKSWLLTKGAWTALKLDKELLFLPVLSFFVLIVVSAVFAIIAWVGRNLFFTINTASSEFDGKVDPAGWVLLALFIISVVAISSLVSGAIIHGALERFKGNDPSVKSSIKASLQRAGSLLKFGILSAGIGFVLSEIANRVPFLGGKLVAWLANAAWNIATFFAIPVIMDSQEPIGPFKATKKSLGIIRKVWGESLIVSLGIGLIGGLVVFGYAISLGAIFALGGSLELSGWFFGPIAILGLIGLIFLVLVLTMLSAFAKAAIYYYAVNGESPVMFDKRLLKHAFSPKKARRVFSH